MFHAYQNAEYADRIDVLRRLFDQPGLHMYPFVELPVNTHLFHVDVAPVSEESRWQRFIFENPATIFEFAEAEEIVDFHIHLQTRRMPGSDYQLKRVVEISIGSATSGELVYVFSCADGSTEISGFSGLSLGDIVRKAPVWRQPCIAE